MLLSLLSILYPHSILSLHFLLKQRKNETLVWFTPSQLHSFCYHYLQFISLSSLTITSTKFNYTFNLGSVICFFCTFFIEHHSKSWSFQVTFLKHVLESFNACNKSSVDCSFLFNFYCLLQTCRLKHWH